ncbi:hypothetical protein LOTGIDRAFT_162717 [Lottia gigantea]|uniref:Fucolectin tachylectin-4 pentraxin-1 domain-containing protein n=1 Tax=Lottia gigantea TaxID=225164 RepID=V3ZM30_LOTGI|nr:hypothetical protein LOTGIDRAFT_162717 [Lottia gigantea]ESO92408.1 hypothetical protein LOTGIDRAFT_162717 [Lottia gigantea]
MESEAVLGTVIDSVESDDVERTDNVPVLSWENGVWDGTTTNVKKAPFYPRNRFISKRTLKRCSHIVTLLLGILLTCVALGLIVAGSFRLHECHQITTFTIQHPIKEDVNTKIGDKYFTVDQLVKLNNYAFNKPAKQSSTDRTSDYLPEVDGDASLAVDGSLDTCSRTDGQSSPSWRVDFGRLMPVGSIRLYLSNFTYDDNIDIFVGMSKQIVENRLCVRHHHGTRTAVPDIRLQCTSELSGRYLGIILNMNGTIDDMKVLVLCEVMVFGR